MKSFAVLLLAVSATAFADEPRGWDRAAALRHLDERGQAWLDFWATWCGPCMAEMPDIAKLIEGYAKAGKPVVVVAVSIDQADDGDEDDIRTKVEKTLKTKELDLQVNPVGRVALDSSLTVARAFKAEAIPQLVVIDPKGVVRHVHIGVTERDTLTEEIDGLLGAMAKP